MRFAALFAAGLAGIAYATAVISADPPHEGPIIERSPVSTKQISAAINNVLASAGLDASESEKIRQMYHVGVDQIDDESDEGRKALSGALSQILASDKVKHIDAAVDRVVDIASSLVERDLDASAGFAPVHGGVAAHHDGVDATRIQKREEAAESLEPTKTPTKTVSVDATDDSGREVWVSKAWELMGTGPGARKDTARIGPMVRKLQQLFPAYNITSPAVDNKTNTTLAAPTNCDCKKVIASVIDPKPEQGMSQAWFINWKQKHYSEDNPLSTRCIETCVDDSIHDFVKKIKEFQAADELSSKPIAEVHAGRPQTHPFESGPISKREEHPAVSLAANMNEMMRDLFANVKPSPAAVNFMEHANEKLGEMYSSRNPAVVDSVKDFAEHMRELFPQPDEKARLTYRKWRESFLKFNKDLYTADKESVSSSGGGEEGGVLVR